MIITHGYIEINADYKELEKMDNSMQKYLDKAEVLIEALPYIQRF